MSGYILPGIASQFATQNPGFATQNPGFATQNPGFATRNLGFAMHCCICVVKDVSSMHALYQICCAGIEMGCRSFYTRDIK